MLRHDQSSHTYRFIVINNRVKPKLHSYTVIYYRQTPDGEAKNKQCSEPDRRAHSEQATSSVCSFLRSRRAELRLSRSISIFITFVPNSWILVDFTQSAPLPVPGTALEGNYQSLKRRQPFFKC
ncbi:hypothetical protein scyTo_0004946 [Scyliorhinus torazame]|uniref:Uncharacterized protein n=1 Tax=Scyliorhinus torazame TaxID=75743 RepID=A0A401NZP2_SCYTO|nr:hypothetical protein [Scyliorhinus torazame]